MHELSARKGRGECRVPRAPAVSRAKLVVSTRASSPQVHRIHPAFPHAMVLTVSSELSPVIGLSCHRHLALPQNLTPASRRQDHTTSPSASAPFVSGAISVHRIPPRVRDDRDTPLCEAGRRGYRSDLGQARTGIFFRIGLDARINNRTFAIPPQPMPDRYASR